MRALAKVARSCCFRGWSWVSVGWWQRGLGLYSGQFCGSLARSSCSFFKKAEQFLSSGRLGLCGWNGLGLQKLAQCAIIINGATLVREAGQGRNPAALSDVERVLFFVHFKSTDLNCTPIVRVCVQLFGVSTVQVLFLIVK